MKPENFQYMATLAKERSGLVLKEDKVYLLDSRLMPLARRKNIETLDEFVEAIRRNNDFNEQTEVVEALTTNETLFFRDTKPFDIFREQVMPTIFQTRTANKKFRIWSAASSSGQEPYSLVMLLDQMGSQLAGWQYEIVGTDLSMEILQKAQDALYTQFEVQRGLPVEMMVKYFEPEGPKWRFKQAYREKVKFQKANLLENQSALGKFDIVFCRNVLIYFEKETKGRVLDMIANMMPADGKLFLGGAETVLGLTDKFEAVQGVKGLYQKTG
ncbi:MAG: protein-glutamate O-methyltransferase CheR [Rhodospirillaceae bacterium]|jgi:chemotaxis protein methyltransferase CheR|nr:protein-glutamate O-methyltransferase CheR [Rhodospirillaceae bacterium]